jgi:hypothetical protein
MQMVPDKAAEQIDKLSELANVLGNRFGKGGGSGLIACSVTRWRVRSA